MGISALPTHVWEFNGNATDSVGNFDLTEHGGYTTGKIGQCLDLQAYAYRNQTYNLGSGEWSISAWFKRSAVDTLDIFILGDIGCSISATGITVYRYSSGALLSAATTNSLNTWYHIVIVRSSDNVLKIYKDGSLIATGTAAAAADGCEYLLAGNDQGVDVYVDQIAIAEVAWTADDATYLYNAGAGRAYADWEVAEPPATGRSFVSKQCFLTA